MQDPPRPPPHSTASSPSLVLLVFSQYWIVAQIKRGTPPEFIERDPNRAIWFTRSPRQLGQLHWPVTELLTN
jgi:hypothetical protein